MEQGSAHDMLITMAAAIPAGVMLIALARKLDVSAIVLLLIGGVALGPEGLGIVRTASLGEGLGVIVSLAVGLVLFEGGLSLDPAGFRAAPGFIRRLLTVGVLTTWLAAATAIYVFSDVLGDAGFGIPFCLLCGSLVIVTGPTVMAPLLKRIRVREKVHSILHWEGVLIDPIGVFIALLCYEWIAESQGASAVLVFAARLAIGTTTGVIGGYAIAWLLRSRWVPADMQNIVALAFAVLVFGVPEVWLSESGLLSVTVCGFVLGVKGPEKLKHLREFKQEITELMIGLLFILLASRLQIAQFVEFGLRGELLVMVLVLVVRPLAVWLSSFGQGLELREKLFLGWVAPRGIVAASMASLIALRFANPDNPERSVFIETFVYSVIATTVLLSGLTAGVVAKWLGLQRPVPSGWLIVGAHRLARQVARFLVDSDVPTVLLDANSRSVAKARARGFEAVRGNALDVEDLGGNDAFLEVGNVLALTDNVELNALVCDRWADVVGAAHVFRWASGARLGAESDDMKGTVVWGDLPAPSLLCTEIARGAARVVPAGRLDGNQDPHARPLAALIGDAVVLDPAPHIEAGEDVGPVLVLRRRGEYFQQALQRGLVARMAPTSLDGLLRDLVDRLVDHVPDTPRAEMLEQLEASAGLLANAPTGGVAVPHASVADLDDRICAVAQIPDGLDLGAPDDAPVRLVFLLLSPPGDPQGHLEALAEIARLVSDPARCDRLVAANGAAAFHEIVRETPAGANPEPVGE